MNCRLAKSKAGESSLYGQILLTLKASTWTTGHLSFRQRSQRTLCYPSWSTTMTWSGQMTSLARPESTWRTASIVNTEPSVACRASTRCKFFLLWRHHWHSEAVASACPRSGKASQGSALISQQGSTSAGLVWGNCPLHQRVVEVGEAALT